MDAPGQAARQRRSPLEALRGILGFSRWLQATLSVAQPVAVALVAVDGFPPAGRLTLGISAAWAGYLAVFALNDLLDVEIDRQRLSHLRTYEAFDIDATLSRHPLARRQIGPAAACVWIGALAAYALVTAYLLHPAAAALFVAAGLLEALYCKLARVTAARFVVNGVMVGVGGLAGWFAMTNEVRPAEMTVVFLWLFTWEVGGRNIVNDFADLEEDERLGIKTVAVEWGPRAAAALAFGAIVAAASAAALLWWVAGLDVAYLVGSVVVAGVLLLRPGITLVRRPAPPQAMALFTHASFYPPAMLAVLVASFLLAG